MAQEARWSLQGDYFENCNCDFLCPCLFSPAGPLANPPTQGYCDVMLAVHVDRGNYAGTSIDGLNAVVVVHADGIMGQGGWKVGLYLDDRASDAQREALEAILSGQHGGPMGAFAPLIGEMLGVKSAPISFSKDGRRRTVSIPNVMQMGIEAVPSLNPESEIWVAAGHPFAPEKLSLATGVANSTYADFGMRWDNSGKNGHYAPISWSNS